MYALFTAELVVWYICRKECAESDPAYINLSYRPVRSFG